MKWKKAQLDACKASLHKKKSKKGEKEKQDYILKKPSRMCAVISHETRIHGCFFNWAQINMNSIFCRHGLKII